ncbi:MAG: 23S rRNA (guanosine(2251)-2'-O)-methyltransferase RlmB [Saprospiraceae bacterium]|nr:23S rRNA (guanosine(2251)-2'-O)-methyltransferase RlmB [Saprospiraceae bacterium]
MEKEEFSDQMLIFGRHPVVDAIESGKPIDKVWVQIGTHGPFEKDLRRICKQHNVPLQMVPKERINREARGNHQGVLAWMAAVKYQQLEEVLPMLFEQGKTPLLLLLDGITDVRNLGAIARSAEICGAHAIIVSQKNSARLNDEALKTSAGALHHIPICREKSVQAALKYLKDSGVLILSSEIPAEKKLHEMNLSRPMAFLIGSEGRGVSREASEQADIRFQIPQVGQTESYNVSVASGIMLYEAMQQRLGNSKPT